MRGAKYGADDGQGWGAGLMDEVAHGGGWRGGVEKRKNCLENYTIGVVPCEKYNSSTNRVAP